MRDLVQKDYTSPVDAWFDIRIYITHNFLCLFYLPVFACVRLLLSTLVVVQASCSLFQYMSVFT